MNSNIDLQYNVLRSLVSYNKKTNTSMNANVQNGDVCSRISLLNSHTFSQDKKSINFNEMNMGVENDDINGGYCYTNSSTGSE